MGTVIAAIVGVVVGAGLVLLMVWLRRRAAGELARALVEQTQAERSQELQSLVHQVVAELAKFSQEAHAANSEQLLRLAETRLSAQFKLGESALETRHKLIDETVKQIAAKLAEVGTTLQTLEKDRRQAYGTLVQQLESTARATLTLQDTTAQLREALANPQRRGQWGERMAEDVLRLAGFVEGVNYRKQAATEGGDRPDFTFLLPQGRYVHMDVKFPLPNYLKCLDAPDEPAREQNRRAFLRDVRSRIKEVTGREYIDPARGTVDYVLVFIPNEQVYGFIHQHDPQLLDDALRQKVVLCSPLTLYAVLAVMRQAAENFRLEQSSREILSLLAEFSKQWQKYVELMDKMGEALDKVMERYGELKTTRTRQLERQLDRIETLRQQENVALPTPSDAEA